jgi:glycine reductase
VKELERAGIPTVHICNLTLVASTVGSPRICPASSILHPLGKVDLQMEREKEFRKQALKSALQMLTQPGTRSALGHAVTAGAN